MTTKRVQTVWPVPGIEGSEFPGGRDFQVTRQKQVGRLGGQLITGLFFQYGDKSGVRDCPIKFRRDTLVGIDDLSFHHSWDIACFLKTLTGDL